MNDDEAKIKGWLDELAARKRECEVINNQKQEAIDAVLTPEIRAALDEIDAQFAGQLAACWVAVSALEGDIKYGVAALGASVKGSALHAVYSQGRVTWDTRALDGYMVAHPELGEFRRRGKPSVSIREVKS